MLKTRVKTAAVLTVVVLAVLYFSHIPYVMEAFTAELGVLGVWELYTVCGYPKKSVLFAVSAALAAVFPFIPIASYDVWLCVLLPVGAALFAIESRDLGRFTLFGRYTPFAFSIVIVAFFRAFPALRAREFGLYELILTIAFCVLTDTGAYFIGRAVGKHRLAPRVSPKKSVEGALGGMAVTAALSVPLCLAAAALCSARVSYVSAVLLAVTVSVVGQAGDLSFSVIKRIAGVKDYGRLMPGHGGVLDRFDSMLFAAPLALIWLRAWPVLIR